jgi:hypothetical protein
MWPTLSRIVVIPGYGRSGARPIRWSRSPESLSEFSVPLLPNAHLYAARCGILHTSTPLSDLEREGKARQVFYRFEGKIGVNMFLNSKEAPVVIDVKALGLAFKEGGFNFIMDLHNDPPRHERAANRAQHFLRWGVSGP